VKPESSLLRPQRTTLLCVGMLAVASLVGAAPALGASPDPSPTAGLYKPDPYRTRHTTPAPPPREPVRPAAPISVTPLPVRTPVVSRPVPVHHVAKKKHVVHRRHVAPKRPVAPKRTVVHLAPAFVTPVHAPPELAVVAAAVRAASPYRVPMSVVLALAALVGLSALFLAGATRVVAR
jgi:hypothetical protein